MTPRALALLAPAVLLLPTAAHAEKVVSEDSVGDVISLAGETSDDPEQAVPAPDYAGVDVVGTSVAHGTSRVRVVVRFRALERDPFQFTVIRVVTAQASYEILAERLGGRPITSIDRGRETVECRGLRTKVDLGADTVTTSVPTSCLDAPRWVQVGVGAVAVAANEELPELTAAYADDAHRDGTIRDRIALGPKVRRG